MVQVRPSHIFRTFRSRGSFSNYPESQKLKKLTIKIKFRKIIYWLMKKKNYLLTSPLSFTYPVSNMQKHLCNSSLTPIKSQAMFPSVPSITQHGSVSLGLLDLLDVQNKSLFNRIRRVRPIPTWKTESSQSLSTRMLGKA